MGWHGNSVCRVSRVPVQCDVSVAECGSTRGEGFLFHAKHNMKSLLRLHQTAVVLYRWGDERMNSCEIHFTDDWLRVVPQENKGWICFHGNIQHQAFVLLFPFACSRQNLSKKLWCDIYFPNVSDATKDAKHLCAISVAFKRYKIRKKCAILVFLVVWTYTYIKLYVYIPVVWRCLPSSMNVLFQLYNSHQDVLVFQHLRQTLVTRVTYRLHGYTTMSQFIL